MMYIYNIGLYYLISRKLLLLTWLPAVDETVHFFIHLSILDINIVNLLNICPFWKGKKNDIPSHINFNFFLKLWG